MTPKNKLLLQTPFAQLAESNRSRIIDRWSFLSKDTNLNNSIMLTDFAIQAGYIEPREPPKGLTLNSWIEKNTAPLWACKSAFQLSLNAGWIPDNYTDWSVFAYLAVNCHAATTTKGHLAALPSHIPKETAAGWISAALEYKQYVMVVKKLLKEIEGNANETI